MKFPTVKGSNLSGRSVRLPHDLDARLMTAVPH